MCLICESGSKIRRTIFGRTFYKVLMETTDGEFRAPFHTSFVYEIGDFYSMKGLKVICNHVNQGFHSYVCKSDAFCECNKMNEKLEKMKKYYYFADLEMFKKYYFGYEDVCGFVVVECRIPFFSRFIMGKNENGGEKAVVSDRIKIVRVIS